jgi:hypothetical protein
LLFFREDGVEGRRQPVVQLEELLSAHPRLPVLADLLEGLLELRDLEVLVAGVQSAQEQDWPQSRLPPEPTIPHRTSRWPQVTLIDNQQEKLI